MEKIGLEAVLDDANFQKGIGKYQDAIDAASGTTEDFASGGIVDLNSGLEDVGETSEGTTGMLTDMWSGMQLGIKVAETVVDVLDELVNGTIDYAMEIKDLALLLGTDATEASTLYQVFDDLRVSTSVLTAASRKLREEGLTPDIDTLVKLSGEYQKLQPGVERTTFLFDTFGRSGIELQKVMESGPEALRAYASAAQETGLIIDDSMVQKMDEARLILDAYGDSLEARKLQLAVAFIGPIVEANRVTLVLNTALEAGIITQQNYIAILNEFKRGELESADAVEMVNGKIEYNNDLHAQALIHLQNEYPVIDTVTESTDLLTGAKILEAQAAEDAAKAELGLNEAYTTQIEQAGNVQSAIEGITGAYDAEKTSVGLLNDAIKTMSDSQVEAERIKLVLKLATEDLTAAEIEELLNQQTTLQYLQDINAALEAGTISKYDWLGIMADGIVTEQEYNTALGITNEELDDIIPGAEGAASAADGAANSMETSGADMAAALEEPLGVATGIETTINNIKTGVDALDGSTVVITIDINGDPYTDFLFSSPPPLAQGIMYITDVLGDMESAWKSFGVEVGQSGATQAIEDMIEALETYSSDEGLRLFDVLMDTAGAFGKLGSAVSRKYKKETVDPLQKSVQTLDDQITDLQARIDAGDMGMYEQQAAEKELLALELQRAAAAEEYAMAQERVLEFEKAQADLQFLQQQMDFLDFLTEHGLDASEILKGIELGLDADLPALLEAMTRAMQELIAQAEDELEIGSPSKAFEDMLKMAMMGAQIGIEKGAQMPQDAMANAMAGLLSPAAALAPAMAGSTYHNVSLNMGGVTIANGMDETAFISKVEYAIARAMQ